MGICHIELLIHGNQSSDECSENMRCLREADDNPSHIKEIRIKPGKP